MGMESLTVIEVVEGSTQTLPAAEALALVNSAPTQWRIEPPYGAAGHMETGLLAAYQEASGNPAATFTDMLTAMIGPVGDTGTPGTDGVDGPPGSTTGVQYIGQVQTPDDLPAEANAGDIYTVIEDRKLLLDAASATGAGVQWTAGEAYVDIYGNFDGATVSLERLGADEATWEQISTVSVTEDTHGPVGLLPVGQVRGAISGGGGSVSVSMTLTNVDPVVYVFEEDEILRSGGVWGSVGSQPGTGSTGAATRKATYTELDWQHETAVYVDPYLAARAAVVHGMGNWDYSRVDAVGEVAAGWTGHHSPAGVIKRNAGYQGDGAFEFTISTAETSGYLISNMVEPINIQHTYSMEASVFVAGTGAGYVHIGWQLLSPDYDPAVFNSGIIDERFFVTGSAGIRLNQASKWIRVAGVCSGIGSLHEQFPSNARYVRRLIYVTGDADNSGCTLRVDYTTLRDLGPGPGGQVLGCRDFGMMAAPPSDFYANLNGHALQRMLDHLGRNGGHGHIECPGTYLIDATCEISGAGPGFILSGLGVGTSLQRVGNIDLIDIIDRDCWEVRDLQLHGDNSVYNGSGHLIAAHNCSFAKIRRVRAVQGGSGAGIYMSCQTAGYLADGYCLIEDCRVDGCGGNGILIGQMLDSHIINCHVTNVGPAAGLETYTPGYGLQLKEGTVRCSIRNSSARGCRGGIVVAGDGDENNFFASYCDVSHNYVECATQSQYAIDFRGMKFSTMLGNMANVRNQMGINTTGIAGIQLKACQRCDVSASVKDISLTTAQSTNTSYANRALKLYGNTINGVNEGSNDNNIQLSVLDSCTSKTILILSPCRRNKIRIGQVFNASAAAGIASTNYVHDVSGASGSNTVVFT